MKESRKQDSTKREKRRFEVRYGVEKPEHKGYTGNISRSGLMLRAVRVFPRGSRLRLEITLDDRRFRIQAEVCWAREGGVRFLSTGRIGMGLRFLEPSEEFLEALDGLKAGSSMRSS
jgi:hypothetical protein